MMTREREFPAGGVDAVLAAVRAAGVVDMRGDGFRLMRRERQGRAEGAGAPVGRGRRVRRSRGGHS